MEKKMKCAKCGYLQDFALVLAPRDYYVPMDNGQCVSCGYSSIEWQDTCEGKPIEDKDAARNELRELREFRDRVIVAFHQNQWREDFGREVEDLLRERELIEPLLEDDPEQI